MRSTDAPEWFQLSLKILIDDRDRAYSEGKLHKYRRLSNAVILHIRKLKAAFLCRVASGQNSRKLWKSLRSFGRLTSGVSSGSIKFSACDFSNYFASNFQIGNVSRSSSDLLPSSSLIPELSCDEVGFFLSKLRNRGSSSDGLPSWIF